MANIVSIVQQIIMLLLITAVGFFLRRQKVMTDPVIKSINTILLQVAWPCMILMTTQKECTQETALNFVLVAAVTVGVLAVLCLIAYVVVKRFFPKLSAPVFTILSVMPNAGFVGLPIIRAVYGDLGVFYLAAFLVGFNLVLWTIGVSFFTNTGRRMLRAALNPGFISAILGTAFFLLHIKLPASLSSFVIQLGSLTTPLSMLLLGARLSRVSKKLLIAPRLWVGCAVKLLVLPLFTFVVMRLLSIDGNLTGVTVMAMAMPSASVVQMFAEKYGDDVELAVAGVSVSMLICILTIPLVLYIAGFSTFM